MSLLFKSIWRMHAVLNILNGIIIFLEILDYGTTLMQFYNIVPEFI